MFAVVVSVLFLQNHVFNDGLVDAPSVCAPVEPNMFWVFFVHSERPQGGSITAVDFSKKSKAGAGGSSWTSVPSVPCFKPLRLFLRKSNQFLFIFLIP